jgi:hypothetical protein
LENQGSQTKEGALVSEEVVIPFEDVFLNADIFEFFSENDQRHYSSFGFKPGMKPQNLVEATLKYPRSIPSLSYVNGELMNHVFLPARLGQSSIIGSPSSYYDMPSVIAFINIINQNFDKGLFQKINIHPHIRKYVFTPWEEALIKNLPGGEESYWMLASMFDISLLIGDQFSNRSYNDLYENLFKMNNETAAYEKLLKQYGKENIKQLNTQTISTMILGVEDGVAKRVQEYSLKKLDSAGIKKIVPLTQRALTDIGAAIELALMVFENSKGTLYIDRPMLGASTTD